MNFIWDLSGGVEYRIRTSAILKPMNSEKEMEPFATNYRFINDINFIYRYTMKNLLAALLVATAFFFSANSYAHHMAEGIISDDLWQMIDDLLEAADSPHLDLDFELMDNAIITTMEVDTSMVNDIVAVIETLNNGRLLVSTTTTEPGLTLITIVETIGNGESQVIYM